MIISSRRSAILLAAVGNTGNTDRTNQVLELLGILVIFCCVLYLAYVSSRFLGKKFSAAGQSRFIKVVDRVSLGFDKHLILVKIGEEYYLFLSGKRDFKMVAKVGIDAETAEEPVQNSSEHTNPVFDFREIFDRYVGKSSKKTSKSKRVNREELPERNEMKENIERLKRMQEKTDDKEV